MLLIVSTLLPSVARAGVLADFIATITGARTAQASSTSSDTPTTTAPASVGNIQTGGAVAPATNIDPSQAGDGNVIVVDNTALVPEEGLSGEAQKKTQNGVISIHTVVAGDTLSGIAAYYGITEGTLLGANDLTAKSVIQPGETLVILPIDGLPYTVKTGDTLESIAQRFNSDATDIGDYNGVDDSTLAVGSDITIPDGEAGSSDQSSLAVTVTPPTGHKKPASSGSKQKPTIASTKILEGSEASGNEIPMANNPDEPARGVGPAGTPDQIAYYTSPLISFIQTQNIHGYNAVDLAAPAGTAIMAAASGEIIVAKEGGWNGGYGSYVVIQHDNGSQTLYAHMSVVEATVGEEVAQGQVIGKVGMTGDATGPHVHFEIRNGIRNPF